MLTDLFIPETEYDIFIKSLLSGDYNDLVPSEEGDDEEEELEDEIERHYELPGDWEPIETDPCSSTIINFDDMAHSKIISYAYPPMCTTDGELAVSDPNVILFKGSDFALKDLCRCLLYVKSSNAVIGDRLISMILGLFATFLPSNNSLATLLDSHPSMYAMLKCLHNMADVGVKLRCFQVDCCPKGSSL